MITDQLFKSLIQNNIKYAQMWGANTDHDINLFPESAFILWCLHISDVCDVTQLDTPTMSVRRTRPRHVDNLRVFWVKDQFLPPELKTDRETDCVVLWRPLSASMRACSLSVTSEE